MGQSVLGFFGSHLLSRIEKALQELEEEDAQFTEGRPAMGVMMEFTSNVPCDSAVKSSEK
jgi:7-keto-8-aminopelargonate synthetase-like enzyme